MAKGFGNTWWGSRWLLSLTHIDYENRIPRGATYARAGAVREIKINGNVISAKVSDIPGKICDKELHDIFG